MTQNRITKENDPSGLYAASGIDQIDVGLEVNKHIQEAILKIGQIETSSEDMKAALKSIQQELGLMKLPDLTKKKHPNLDDLLNIVSKETGIPVEDITGKNRRKDIVDARKIFCLFAGRHYPLTVVGRVINMDHSSVIYARKKAMDFYEIDKEFKQVVGRVGFFTYGTFVRPDRAWIIWRAA